MANKPECHRSRIPLFKRRDAKRIGGKRGRIQNKRALRDTLALLKEQALSYNAFIPLRETGYVRRPGPTGEQFDACHAIIHSAAAASFAGHDPSGTLSAEQDMIERLADVFGVSMSHAGAAALRDTLAGALPSMGRKIVRVLVGWLPFAGNVIDCATTAGLTETLGWSAVAYFFNLEQHAATEQNWGFIPMLPSADA